MKRLFAALLILAVLALIVFAAVSLAEQPGRVLIVWGGFRADPSVGRLALAALALTAGLALAVRLLFWLFGTPAAIARLRRERRRREGYHALTQGLTAVAAGEADEALRLARKADALLADPPLTLLLRAQAAQLSGDEAGAHAHYTAMLAQPHTEFLGLRGLLTHALKSGDDAAALSLAKRAQRLRPKAGWALAQLSELQTRAGQWAEAASTLAHAIKRRTVPQAEGQRKLAAILLEQSRAAASGGDQRLALTLAGRARDTDTGFAPAAIWYAGLLRDQGRIRQALKVVETAWQAAPQPLLAETYRSLVPDETPLARVKRFERLQEANPDHPETHLAMAEAALAAQLWGEARRHLARLGAGKADSAAPPPAARICRLMARLEEAERGDSGSARAWLHRAATTATADAAHICDKCGAQAADFAAHCENCGAFASLHWRHPVRSAPQAAAVPAVLPAPAPAEPSPSAAAPISPPLTLADRLTLRRREG